MPGVSMSHLSTQYVLVPVRAWQNGLPFNPASPALPVQMSFPVGGNLPVTWFPATWAYTSTTSGYYEAQCLVGPGPTGVVLAVGLYTVWLQITGSPEIPIISTGSLTIT